jgi:hypothetical protein
MSKDPEDWRDVLQNFQCFLEHADWAQKTGWVRKAESRTTSAKVSLAYRWKAEALGKFESVEVENG